MDKIRIRVEVNGKPLSAEIEPHVTLLEFIRVHLGLTGTKEGCGRGDCGACTVLVDGEPVLSCIKMAFQVDGCSITTIEGIGENERLDILQRCFVDHGAIQCGFCTPAMILVAKALLRRQPNPSRDMIRRAISGVLCRCTGYRKIVDAIETAAGEQGGGR